MKLYLDTADVAAWREYMPSGIYYGITTNPILAQDAGFDYATIDWEDLLQTAAALGAQEFHCQVFGPPESYRDWAGQVTELGQKLGLSVVIKIPLVPEAIEQVRALQNINCLVMLTAAYHAHQTLIAKNLGVDYLAPYLGRMQDQGIDAMAELEKMIVIGKNSGFQILAASIRNLSDLMQLQALGCYGATVSVGLAKQLIYDPLSQMAYEQFEAAAAAKSVI